MMDVPDLDAMMKTMQEDPGHGRGDEVRRRAA